jgi:hypothetical protein
MKGIEYGIPRCDWMRYTGPTKTSTGSWEHATDLVEVKQSLKQFVNVKGDCGLIDFSFTDRSSAKPSKRHSTRETFTAVAPLICSNEFTVENRVGQVCRD